jgi:hypothetical protein
MSKVVPFHSADGWIMPLTGGATIHVTSFRDSARVAVSIVGPQGGDAGGFVLTAEHARILGSWLLTSADDEELAPPPERTPPAPDRVPGQVRAFRMR